MVVDELAAVVGVDAHDGEREPGQQQLQGGEHPFLLNHIWDLDAIFTNYLLPQQKLIAKVRHGATVTKKYDPAQTPHQRALADPTVRARPKITMNAEFKRIKPAALSRKILALTRQLEIPGPSQESPPVPPTGQPRFQPHLQPGPFPMRQRLDLPGPLT